MHLLVHLYGAIVLCVNVLAIERCTVERTLGRQFIERHCFRFEEVHGDGSGMK